MYSAYHSYQFGSDAPVRFSCMPCATVARRSALAKSFAEAKLVAAGSMRPGGREVIS